MAATVTSPAAAELDRGDRPADEWRVSADLELGRVVLDLERRLDPGAASAARQQPPTDGQKQEPADRDPKADRHEVEHVKRLAGQLFADTGDQQIGRGSDQRHRAAEQRGEAERHQQFRRRALVAARDLKSHRHKNRQRTDVLDEGRKPGDAGRKDADLERRRAQQRREPAHQDIDSSRAGDRGADDERPGDQRQHRVRKAGKRALRGDDADRCRGHQRDQADEVVAQPVPQEETDHTGQHSEGQDLVAAQQQATDECRRSALLRATSAFRINPPTLPRGQQARGGDFEAPVRGPKIIPGRFCRRAVR